jgi:hypothetical protein
MNNALNFENTLSISFAFLARIWFSTRDILIVSILGGHPNFRALYNIKSQLG